MATPTLYGMHYSPWTIRARWALVHHRVKHRYVEHMPFLGEPLLRRRARRAGMPTASVPLYLDGEHNLGSSWAIMQHADRVGRGPSLRTDDPAVQRWEDTLEPALQELRARVTRKILGDPEALTEAASAAAPGPLATLARPIAAKGARYLADKYGFSIQGDSRPGVVEAALEALRAGIDGGHHVEGDALSAADLVAATFLQGIRPVEQHIRLRPATRRAWTSPLAADHEDLLAWRDQLFARHFRRAGSV